MRKKYVLGNWKMYHNHLETTSFFSKVEQGLVLKNNLDLSQIILGIALPSINIALALKKSRNIQVLGQNVYFQDYGAYTGETAVGMLQSLGVKYCLVGHSERRVIFHETNDEVNLKVKKLLQANIIPVICLGENLMQYQKGQSKDVCYEQLKEALKGLTINQVFKIIVAYEPVWAIGTGKSASIKTAQKIIAFLRLKIASLYEKQLADKIPILYGGSVSLENVVDFVNQKDIDGVLVGSASLEANSFLKMVELVNSLEK